MRFFISFLFSLIFCVPSGRAQESKPFRVGTTSGYAPYVSLNDQAAYEGFDVDIAHLLAKKLNRPLEVKDFGSMAGLMLALKQGKVDALIWAISITDQRLKSMDMIYYQGEKVHEMSVVFWQSIPEEIHSLSDLGKDPKKSVVVEAGSYQESVLTRYPEVRLIHLDKISDVILSLKYGKAMAACIDEALLPSLKSKYPQLMRLKIPLSGEESSQGNGICVDRSHPELALEIRRAVEELREEGTITALEKKWGLIP